MDEARKKVDEDWKSQVAREKTLPAGKAQEKTSARSQRSVSFAEFVSGVAVQAVMALGQDERGAAIPPDLLAAKHLIDVLDMLKAKTKGNLDPQEQAVMDDVLYRLHMAYVDAVRHVAERGGKTGEV